MRDRVAIRTILGVLMGLLYSPLLPAQQQRASRLPDSKVHYVARWDAQQSGVTERLTSVFFLNANVGWAAGENNVVIKTTDGGATWKLLTERGGPEFTHVVFVDESEGWVQSSSILLHTTDGGESWQPANFPPGGGAWGPACMLGKVRYQLVGGVGAGLSVFRTTDGGNTWETLPAQLPRNDFGAIFFVDPQHGWVSGDASRFAMTVDGGQSWKQVNAPEGNLHRMQFVTPIHGWVLPYYAKGGPVMTTDGGLTWTNQYAAIQSFHPLQDLHFFNENDGLLLSETSVQRTSNGGKTWTRIGNLQFARRMSFPTLDEGWVVVGASQIMHYHLVPAPAQGK